MPAANVDDPALTQVGAPLMAEPLAPLAGPRLALVARPTVLPRTIGPLLRPRAALLAPLVTTVLALTTQQTALDVALHRPQPIATTLATLAIALAVRPTLALGTLTPSTARIARPPASSVGLLVGLVPSAA